MPEPTPAGPLALRDCGGVSFPAAAAPLLPLAVSGPWAGPWLAACLKLATQRSRAADGYLPHWWLLRRGGHWGQRGRRQWARFQLALPIPGVS